jgi:hypothetical protein
LSLWAPEALVPEVFNPEVPTRTEVLTFISKSASYGNLGLFVGAGFSKAVLNDPMKIALSWRELLEQSAKKLKVDYRESLAVVLSTSSRSRCLFQKLIASRKSGRTFMPLEFLIVSAL